jgi:16S rRNA (guanine966-N2)-methyltransferase
MQIISGFLKGRKLKGYHLVGVRPTMSRVRESLMAMIQDSIQDSICLDLFAGTGSLGIEAISNGANLVYFVDNNNLAINTIKENINNLNIKDKAIVLGGDYQKILEELKKRKIKFDIIFLDPPYNEKILDDSLKFIVENDLLNKDGQVICEYSNNVMGNNFNYLKCVKEKKYGNKRVKVYKRILL